MHIVLFLKLCYNIFMKNLEIKIHGTYYPVVIDKKKNKNTYIRVNQDLEIYVTTSYFTTNKAIMKLIKENKDIRKYYKEISKNALDLAKMSLQKNNLKSGYLL